jgi:hypothetical protein
MIEKEFFARWRALQNAPTSFSDMEAWRSCLEEMRDLLAFLDLRFRVSDEAELERLRARTTELEQRLGVKAAPAPIQKREPSPLDETDFGNGVGGRGENVSASAFVEELHSLREYNMGKRRRLNG